MLADLRRAVALPDAEKRYAATVASLRALVIGGTDDELTMGRARRLACPGRCAPPRTFDALLKKDRESFSSELCGGITRAAAAAAAMEPGDAPEWPEGAMPMDGPSPIGYALGDGKALPGTAAAGAVLEVRGKGSQAAAHAVMGAVRSAGARDPLG